MKALIAPVRTQTRRLIGVSLKMYFGLTQTRAWLREVAALGPLVAESGVDVFVLPDFLSIVEASKILASTSVHIGAQDVFWDNSGPYTGEVSPNSLREAGCTYAEVGHAERRRLFHEDNTSIAAKARAAANAGLVPLVCVGESSFDGVAAAIDECVKQLAPVIDAIPSCSELAIAYEPVWAIGASEPASSEHIVAVTTHLRELTHCRPGLTRIVYGGSAGPGLFSSIAESVDGLFLGRRCHDVHNLRAVLGELDVGIAVQRGVV